MTGKILIVYSTKSGVNAQAADVIADALKTTYNMDVTIADLKNGSPDITPYQNIIVGGGVKSTSVYNEAVDFLAKDFTGRNVALYFCCEDEETPKTLSTEDNTKKALAKNTSLKPIDTTAFGGCMIRQGRAVMDDLNMTRIREWSIELGKKFNIQYQTQPWALSIDGGFVNSNTKITIHLRNIGSTTLDVTKVYVDGDLQSMNSVVLSPNRFETVTINGAGTNWANGASHTVKIVAEDGTSVVYNVHS
jgi:menaquinone-dependent protoporphyrinogen IX oxidase